MRLGGGGKGRAEEVIKTWRRCVYMFLIKGSDTITLWLYAAPKCLECWFYTLHRYISKIKYKKKGLGLGKNPGTCRSVLGGCEVMHGIRPALKLHVICECISAQNFIHRCMGGRLGQRLWRTKPAFRHTLNTFTQTKHACAHKCNTCTMHTQNLHMCTCKTRTHTHTTSH